MKIRTDSLVVLKNVCFLADRYPDVRLRVARLLGGVDGMLALVRDPRKNLGLQVENISNLYMTREHHAQISTTSLALRQRYNGS